MTYRIGIVAHQQRADAAHALQEQVGAVFLHMDNGNKGCNASHRRVWEWLSTRPVDRQAFCVVLEDDAVPVEDFNTQLHKALAVAPTDVVSLYLGTSRPVWLEFAGRGSAQEVQPLIRAAVTKADTEDASFITSTRVLHGVALCIRTRLIGSMLDFTQQSTKPHDHAIGDWCYNEGHTVAYTFPSIIDHEDRPTLFHHPDGEPRQQSRKAHRFGTRDTWTSKGVAL